MQHEYDIESLDDINILFKYLYLKTDRKHPLLIKNMTLIHNIWMDSDCNLKQANGNYVFITIQDLLRIIDDFKNTKSEDFPSITIWDEIIFEIK